MTTRRTFTHALDPHTQRWVPLEDGPEIKALKALIADQDHTIAELRKQVQRLMLLIETEEGDDPMTTRTTTTRTRPAQLTFLFTPATDNRAYAVAAGLVPADAKVPVVALDDLAVMDTNRGEDTRRLDQLLELHHIYQAAANRLPDVTMLMPEASGVVGMVDAALRKLVNRLDAELTNE